MQLKSLEPESSRESYEQLLNSLTRTTDTFTDQNICKNDRVYFCDLGHVCDRLEQFKKTFDHIQPCYPVECNDAKDLLTVLANSGVCFSCSNKQNVKSVCDAGNAKSAIFGTALVQKSHLKYSQENGIDVMVFQSELELKKLAVLPLSANCRFIIQFNWESGEGLNMVARVQQMKKLVKMAEKKQLRVVGISLGDVPEEMKDSVCDLVDGAIPIMSFMESIGFEIEIFDLGNCCSLASASLEMTESKDIDALNSAVDNGVFSRWPSIIVLADVGRIVARSAFSLMATVTGVESIEPNEDSLIDGETSEESLDGCIYINDSVYGSFSKLLQTSSGPTECPRLINAVPAIDPESDLGWCENMSSKSHESKLNYCVRGKSGDALDVVSCHYAVFQRIDIGDKLVFEDMGDYHSVMRTAHGNGEAPPTMQSFINADKIEIAKRLQRKPFSFKKSAVNFERDSCPDPSHNVNVRPFNVGGCSAICADELSYTDFDVIFENMALLEQTHMSARNLDDPYPVGGLFPVTFDSDQSLDSDDMPLLEQMRLQPNPFSFI